MSPYTYAGLNPLGAVDPNGASVLGIAAIIGILLVVVTSFVTTLIRTGNIMAAIGAAYYAGILSFSTAAVSAYTLAPVTAQLFATVPILATANTAYSGYNTYNSARKGDILGAVTGLLQLTLGAGQAYSAGDADPLRLSAGVYSEGFTGAEYGYSAVPGAGTTAKDREIGFKWNVFTNGERTILVFAGSDGPSWKDWAANFAQAFGFETAQYARAKQLAREYSAIYPGLEYSGHSLGGGLAIAAAAVTGGRAIVANAAGVHPRTVGGIGPLLKANVTQYRSTLDVLRIGNAITPTLSPGRHVSLGPFSGVHGAKGVCGRIGGC